MNARVPQDQARPSPVSLAEYNAMDRAQRRKLWLEISDITPAELEAHMAEEESREARVPQPGQMAPDFTADVLDRDKKLTGETFSLSALRGRPVALVFGSFT